MRVVKYGNDVEKFKTCDNCLSLIAYLPKDVRYETDDKVYIVCPVCCERIDIE